MFRASGSPAAVSSLPAWHILFAREEEPDLELDEPVADDTEEMDAEDNGGEDPQGSGGDRRQKIVKLALLALVAGAGLYVAMDPGILMGPSEEPPPVPAPAPPKAAQAPAAQPKPIAQPPAVAPPTAQALSPAPAAGPQAMAQSQAPKAMPAAPTAPMPPQPKSPMPSMASTPAPAMPAPPKPAAASTGLSPLFGEGQLVLILPDPTKPTGPVALMADAGSNRQGPTVGPNVPATVLDGELRNNGWIYAIRTVQGTTGWISEKQLQAK